MSEHITWLTQTAYDRLVAELAEREGPVRADIVAQIATTRAEGDLSENGGYHAAREEQGKNEARIAQLRHLIENSKVGQPEAADGEVHIGRVVTIEQEDAKQFTFLIAHPSEAEYTEQRVVTPASPIGEAVIGHRIGDSVTYTTPRGIEMTVTIVDVTLN